jgi:hypothetical protein
VVCGGGAAREKKREREREKLKFQLPDCFNGSCPEFSFTIITPTANIYSCYDSPSSDVETPSAQKPGHPSLYNNSSNSEAVPPSLKKHL